MHTDNIQNWNFYVSKTGNYPSAWRQIHKGMQYIHTTLLSNKKEQTSDTCKNMDDSQKQYCEQKKAAQMSTYSKIPLI